MVLVKMKLVKELKMIPNFFRGHIQCYIIIRQQYD